MLAVGVRFVIRYDHRDTGRSVTYPPRSPGYDARRPCSRHRGRARRLWRPAAHVVGVSAGRALMQRLALDYPRVPSLVLISTCALW